jgi:hypothetical protein
MEIAKLGGNLNSFGFFVAGTASGTLSKVTAVQDAKQILVQLREKKMQSKQRTDVSKVKENMVLLHKVIPKKKFHQKSLKRK